jgi:hypothetical protein
MSRTPLIRIMRPYSSEEEFINGDFAWIGRTTVILPNGPARPEGELVRFEIVLANGAPVFRGEGHAVAYHTPSGTRPPGLEVRFRRIDARSKVLLDRVRAKRTTLFPSGLPAAVVVQTVRPASKVVPPVNRDEILERLRVRARELGPAKMLAFKRS